MGRFEKRQLQGLTTFRQVHFKDLAHFTPKQQQAIELMDKYKFLLYGGAMGGGKQININTLIPTPTGYKKMADLCVGDYVLSSSGFPVEIIWTSSVDYNPDAYELEFDTGEKIQADANHLWLTMNEKERAQQKRLTDEFRKSRRANRPSRASNNPKKIQAQTNITKLNKSRIYDYKLPTNGTIRTTKELFDTVLGKCGFNHSVEVAAPIELPESILPIDPYLFGLWLGDGYSASGSIGMSAEDVEQLQHFLPKIKSKKIITKNRLTPFTHVCLEGLTTKLRQLGCIRNKHIPIEYLRGSLQQRIALLQGIMDTDGYCSKDGKCGIQLSNRKLAEDVLELISSLGIKAQITNKEAKIGDQSYGLASRICFMCDFPAFRLPRKLTRQKLTGLRLTTKRRYIISIKKIVPVPMKCIQVANPDGMYLVGRTFIATHNSYWLRWALLRYLIQQAKAGNQNVRAALFCEDYPAVKDRHLSKISFEFPNWLGKLNESEHEFKLFPQYGGGVLCFRNLDDPSKYQSAEFAAIGVDELTKNDENVFTFLRTRLRWPGIPDVKFIAATNPGDIGHVWVHKRFVAQEHDPNECEADKFGFVQALADDNPHLDAGYLKTLDSLPEELRKAFRNGSWDVFKGQFFTMWSAFKHVIDSYQPTEIDRISASCDWGFSPDAFAYHLHAVVKVVLPTVTFNRIITFAELYGHEKYPEDWAKEIKQLENGKTIVERFLDPSAFNRFPVSTLKNKSGDSIANEFERNGIRFTRGNNDRANGYQAQRNWLRIAPDGLPYWQVTKGCQHLISQMPAAIYDPNNSSLTKDGGEDHAREGVRYFLVSQPTNDYVQPVKTNDYSEDYFRLLREENGQPKRPAYA